MLTARKTAHKWNMWVDGETSICTSGIIEWRYKLFYHIFMWYWYKKKKGLKKEYFFWENIVEVTDLREGGDFRGFVQSV